MIEFALTPAGAHRVRFRLSPLDELLGAIQVIHGRRTHPAHQPWLDAAAGKAAVLPIDELVAVLGDDDYTCEFLSPPPSRPDTTVAAQLAQVRRTPPEQVARELRLLDGAPKELLDDPRRARDLLADQLGLAWQELIAPCWPRVRNALTSDILHRSARLAEGGLASAVANLSPAIRVVEGKDVDTLAIRSGIRLRLPLDRRGLLLIPSVFTWPKVGAITVGPWQPAVLYPARGIGGLWAGVPDAHDALSGLLGRTKATLLHALDDPATTSALASRLGLAASTVSEHLTALRAGGLLTTTRRGTSVIYSRTSLGEALLGR
jgi:hypothetical protein